jgi:hypothetical protein
MFSESKYPYTSGKISRSGRPIHFSRLDALAYSPDKVAGEAHVRRFLGEEGIDDQRWGANVRNGSGQPECNTIEGRS